MADKKTVNDITRNSGYAVVFYIKHYISVIVSRFLKMPNRTGRKDSPYLDQYDDGRVIVD